MISSHSAFVPDSSAIDIDICELLHTMKLGAIDVKESENDVRVPTSIDVRDVLMHEDPSYHSDAASDCSSSNSYNDVPYGCAYLRAIKHQIDNFVTTSGEYLEAIFTHREILSSFPAGHHQCARGFSDIAYMLEQRAWRADRDADTEAVAAFRHEAWVIAATLPTPPNQSIGLAQPSYVCIMPAM